MNFTKAAPTSLSPYVSAQQAAPALCCSALLDNQQPRHQSLSATKPAGARICRLFAADAGTINDMKGTQDSIECPARLLQSDRPVADHMTGTGCCSSYSMANMTARCHSLDLK